MEIIMNSVQLMRDNSQLLMHHRDVEISWKVAPFERIEKSSERVEFDLFEQINHYWKDVARRGQEERLDKIFDVYRRIYELFYSDIGWRIPLLTQRLYPLVAELYELHPLEDMRMWYNFHSGLQLHPNWDFKDSFNAPDATSTSAERSYKKESTYTKPEYRELVLLSVALRPMIPIWGEFIIRTHGVKNTKLKEYYAFKLLSDSALHNCGPMERLREYVEHALPADKLPESVILKALSTEDYPQWLLALTVVRRLAIGDVRALDPQTHLVSYIFKYITQKIKGSDNDFMGLVKPKQVEGQSTEGENNNLSKLEGYKVKQEIPAGDIALLSQPMKKPLEAARVICPDLPLELVEEALQSVRALETKQIQQPQIYLTQWVIKNVVPAHGLMYLKKQLVLNAMAVAQACLWHRGHYELAGLTTAAALSNADTMFTGGTETRARIPKEYEEKLNQLFPYQRRPQNSSKQKGAKQANVGRTAIESMSKMLAVNDWELTLTPERVQQLTGNRNVRRYSVPHDIKVKLSELTIQIASQTF